MRLQEPQHLSFIVALNCLEESWLHSCHRRRKSSQNLVESGPEECESDLMKGERETGGGGRKGEGHGREAEGEPQERENRERTALGVTKGKE